MTPKEKAIELVDKFKELYDYGSLPKESALIAVDFAMNSKYSFRPMHGGWVSGKLYYEELKQEIQKL